MKTKLLTTTTTTTAERIAQAKARHATHSYKPMIATTGDYAEIIPAVHDMTPAQLYRYPELCAYLVTRARHRETGLELFAQLATSAKHDAAIMYDRTNRAEREMTTRKEYEQARDTAAELDRIAASITTDTELAETAAEMARDYRTQRDNARAYADDMEQDNTGTTSERATMVQAAVMRLVEMLEHGDNVADIIPELCKAAGDALGQLSNPDAMTRCKTVTRWMDKDEAAAIINKYAIDLGQTPPQHIPAANTRSGAACYRTVETRDRRAERKTLNPAELARKATTDDGKAICIIYHYRTTAPYVTFSQFSSPENAPELADNAGVNAILCQSDAERITELLDRANLSERERLLVMYAASQTAESHYKAAYKSSIDADRDTIAQTDTGHRAQAKTRAKTRAQKAGIKARWSYAFDRLSKTDTTPGKEYTTSTRDKMRQRIERALTKAYTRPDPDTPPELADKERKQWERLQRNTNRGHASTTDNRPDIIQSVHIAAMQTPDTIPGVDWISKAQAHNRRQEQTARLDRLMATSRIDNTTPDAIARAKAGEEDYTRKAQAREEQARAKAQAKADARAQAEKVKRGIYGLHTSFQMWQSWTDAERAEHIQFLANR